MPENLDQERKDRVESLRLTQLALNVEIEPWHLPEIAHWVHTGEELKDPRPLSSRGVASPDAARWTPGDPE